MAALFLLMSAPSFAADNTYLYIVHGIPSRDVAAILNPVWPVDISLSGECYVRGLAFGNTSGPLTIPAGRVEVKVSFANSPLPCSEAPMPTKMSPRYSPGRQRRPKSPYSCR